MGGISNAERDVLGRPEGRGVTQRRQKHHHRGRIMPAEHIEALAFALDAQRHPVVDVPEEGADRGLAGRNPIWEPVQVVDLEQPLIAACQSPALDPQQVAISRRTSTDVASMISSVIPTGIGSPRQDETARQSNQCRLTLDRGMPAIAASSLSRGSVVPM